MNRFTLTEEEKASLELQHLQCKDKKDSDRLKAVLLRSEEWTVPKISCSFGRAAIKNIFIFFDLGIDRVFSVFFKIQLRF